MNDQQLSNEKAHMKHQWLLHELAEVSANTRPNSGAPDAISEALVSLLLAPANAKPCRTSDACPTCQCAIGHVAIQLRITSMKVSKAATENLEALTHASTPPIINESFNN